MLAPRDSGDITDVYGTTGRWFATLVLALLAILVVVLFGWVAASIISLVRDDAEGRPLSAASALRAGRRERAGIVAAILLTLAALLMTGSLILIPLAGWLLSVCAAAPAAAVVEELPVREAFRRSAELTRGHRWRTLIVQTHAPGIGLALPGLVGALLLLLTGWPFWVSRADQRPARRRPPAGGIRRHDDAVLRPAAPCHGARAHSSGNPPVGTALVAVRSVLGRCHRESSRS